MEIRNTDPTVIPPAETSYLDWTGTSCAESSMIATSGDLYRLAGLADERERWTILGIEIDGFSHGEDPRWTIRVYAADRHEHHVENFDDWSRVAADHGGIPVVDVLLHDVTLDDLVRCMKLFTVQLRNGHLPHPLLRAAHADHPDQE